ncbi:MAG: signal peptidase II [Rhodobacteraceae bacterium]|nr:signal peptidase II [Paracoccaceae bacterium]
MQALLIPAVLMFAVDQASKYGVVWGLNLIELRRIEVLPPYLVFQMGWNEGINFGLFSGAPDAARWILIAIALAVCTWVGRWALRDRRPRVMISAGLLIGGALGNVVDRLIHGAVADFLNMSCCGIDNPFSFNLADVGVFAGAAGLIVLTWRDDAQGKVS